MWHQSFAEGRGSFSTNFQPISSRKHKNIWKPFFRDADHCFWLFYQRRKTLWRFVWEHVRCLVCETYKELEPWSMRKHMTKQANRGSATVNCVFALCYALKSVSVALHSCCSSCPVSTEIHQYQYHHHHHHMSNSNICPCHLRTNKLSSIKYIYTQLPKHLSHDWRNSYLVVPC